MTDRTFPRVLHAVENIELGKWPLVDALLAEVAQNDRGAKDGEIARVVAFLAENDYRDYSESHVRQLFLVGRWVDSYAHANELRAFPVNLVRIAKDKAKGDHRDALSILRSRTSFRQIEGRSSERRAKTPLDKIGRAVSFAWEIQEHFIEGYTPATDEERYWLVTLAEKLERLARIIEQQARGSVEIDEFDRDEFFRDLEEFKAAH